MTTPRALLLGCGDLGTRIGLRLAGRGLEVTGVRRDTTEIPPPIHGMSADLVSGDLPDLSTDLLAVALTADARDEGGYRRTYVEGMGRGLSAVLRGGMPRRAVLVSSTSVIGPSDGVVDESTPARPATATARVLLEAERLFLDAIPHGTVLRPSGLYGKPGSRLVAQVRRGENPDPGRIGNRVHRDDAAAAVAHLLTREEAPEPLYLANDQESCPVGEVRDFIADQLGLPRPRPTGKTAPYGKRIDASRLLASGLVLTHPTYREGLAAMLAGDV